jgi:hypothetical protein
MRLVQFDTANTVYSSMVRTDIHIQYDMIGGYVYEVSVIIYPQDTTRLYRKQNNFYLLKVA